MTRAKPQGAALFGRRTGIALFWCMAVFVIGASARSVIGELYGSAGAPRDTADTLACATSLRALHRELLDHASAELRLPRDRDRQARWLSAWDRSFALSGEHCGELNDTRRTLRTLRERVEALLQGYARDDVPLTERIERALERIAPPPAAKLMPLARSIPLRKT